jgi:Rps23 Pro-64 3,4-dihydroxylase Tpa1-like proline 4-hydroxylase
MNIINPELVGINYRNEFLTKGSVTINNFMIPEKAEQLYQFFNNDMPETWWSAATHPGVDGNISYIKNFPENQEIIAAEKKRVSELFAQGHFSYHFHRTVGDHYQNCTCPECDFRRWLVSNECLGFLEAATGIRHSGFNTMFASRYMEGCFLSPHHDHNLGSIGFVFQLTKNWRPEWGGLLHFMSDDRTLVEHTEVPTFNSLTLFHLPDGSGKWHYVSHVAPEVKSKRLAYTGWFVKENTEKLNETY